MDHMDRIVAQAVGIVSIGVKKGEGVSVVLVESRVGAYPDKTAIVLRYAESGALGKSVFNGQVLELYVFPVITLGENAVYNGE
jgi:hypothetical protein